jgi:hypothetical protein
MKCLLCTVEIDENKSFPGTPGPDGQMIEDVMGKWNHSKSLLTWTHVALTAQTGGGSMSILSGHICSAHPVRPGSVALAAALEVVAPKASAEGKPPTAPPAQEAVKAPVPTTSATNTPKGK